MLVIKPELIVYDFDGVMTDNRVVLREDGLESVIVNRSDGLAVSILKGIGIKQVIMSTEKNKVVASRAKKLGIQALQNISDKRTVLKKYCKENKISLENVLYVGNELNDLDAMRIVGYTACPYDACKEVKTMAKIVLNSAGGAGVARELLEHIIAVQIMSF